MFDNFLIRRILQTIDDIKTMASDPRLSHYNFKVEPTELQGSIPPVIINIKSEPRNSYLAQMLLSNSKKCPKCKINISEESFGQHILVCSINEKETQLDGDNNDSHMSSFEENRNEVMEEMECTDSERSSSLQQSLSVSRGIENNDNEGNNYYTTYRHSHWNSEGSGSTEGLIPSEDDKSDDDAVNDFLLQDSTYSCSMCSFTTDREQALSQHERYHKNSTLPILNCIYCNQKYIEKDLHLHIGKIHPGQKLQGITAAGLTVDLEQKTKLALQCPKCKYVGKNDLLLRAHLERHKFKETGMFVRKDDGCWQCDLCSHSTKHICDLQKHRTSHEYYRIQKCPWCDFKSTSKIIHLHKVRCSERTKNVPVEVESNPPVRNNTNSSDKTKKVPVDVESDPPVINNIKYSEETENLPVEVELNPSVTNNSKCSENTKVEVESNPNNIKQVFKCAHCPFSTDSQLILKSHMQYKHRLYQCPHCSIAVKSSSNFRSHLRMHKRYLQNVKCSNCDFEGPLPTLRAHCFHKSHKLDKRNVKKAKSNMEDETGSLKKDKEPKNHKQYAYKCYNCSFSTIQREFLKIHLKTHTEKQPVNKCSECDYQSTPQTLQIHIFTCHKTEELAIEHKTGRCFVCSASFKKNFHYQNHWKTHVEGSPIIKCKSCDFKSTPSVMITHRKKCRKTVKNSTTSEITKEKAFDLDKNEEKVSDEGNAKNTQNENYEHIFVQCNLCDARLTKNSMKSHVKTHAKYPIEKCQHCNFKSTRRYLQTHIGSTGHYSDNNRNNFVFKHKKIQCALCDAKVFKSHFQRHMESHSTLELKQCSKCSFKSTPKYLERHVKEMGHYIRYKKKATPEMTDEVNENKKEGKEKLVKDDSAAFSDEKSDSTINAFRCSLCSFSTNLRFKLNMHKKKDHQDSIVEIKKILNCSLCSWATQNNQHLEEHLNAHYNCNKPVMQCAYCFFKGTATEIKYHEQCTVPKPENRTKPNIKVLLKCTQSQSCNFTTYLPAEFKNHNHLKSIKCDICSFSSFYQYRVDAHLLSHTKYNMPVETCPDCDFHSTPATLSAHKNKCMKRKIIEEILDSTKKRRVTQ
ncbi:unnamed protein product [Ceutorhynchus assimilis]|uniref:C2H2-type domain-containing protein n=1 Tax=Ceutorhynchus assimilis TaxID=467358 RepID=A0A9P0GSA6_9CUCU|nr:unnamed protein product [Ceutorhynchus assimilis]